jgi:RimJ/RimL family protein N-acetyltransferase
VLSEVGSPSAGGKTVDGSCGERFREPGEAELGYMFLPEAWGRGYAAEARTPALDWFAAPPDEPMELCT